MNIGSAEQKTLATLKNLSAEAKVEAAKIVGTFNVVVGYSKVHLWAIFVGGLVVGATAMALVLR